MADATTGRGNNHLGCPAMPDEPVLTERRDGVLLITLNRPDARNAVNAALAQGLGAALDALDADSELSVGVLTGAGKGFSAGMDLKAFVAGENPRVEGRGFAGVVSRSSGVRTGGGRGFSAGMDLKAFVAGENPRVEGRGFAGIVQRSARKPLIAAIEGFAVAGGL